jgi:hypothetical protein
MNNKNKQSLEFWINIFEENIEAIKIPLFGNLDTSTELF